jgi:eukaryotic-like serine/threonine-protein kinase
MPADDAARDGESRPGENPPKDSARPRRVRARIVEACERFEVAWRAGDAPKIETFLALASESDRPKLLRRLLELEIALRKFRGESPARNQYRARFSDDSTLVDAVFAEQTVSFVTPDKSLDEPEVLPWSVVQEPRPGTRTRTYEPKSRDPATTQSFRRELPSGDDDPEDAILRGRLGRFEIQQLLGEGAFGRAFRAYDPVLDRAVVLKIPKFAPDQKNQVERFFREGKATARLRHPNIVAVHDAGREGATF